jgi:peptidoglycan/LPS O-acetylase OafA/YrhL
MTNKNKRFIAALIAAILAAGVIFLAGAFIAWDVNPGHWDPFGRAMCALVMICVFVGVTSLGATDE